MSYTPTLRPNSLIALDKSAAPKSRAVIVLGSIVTILRYMAEIVNLIAKILFPALKIRAIL